MAWGITDMKLLFLTFYYAPDLSAGSFRAAALVRALASQLPPDAEIDVVTTLPNRYRSFSVDVPAFEQHGPVRIHRIALPAHRSGMLDQSRAFAAYASGTLRVIGGRRYAMVFATSSRLMTAALGSFVSRRFGIPLYLDIRDIFLENIQDVLPGAARALRPALGALERFAFGRASYINLVSEGFGPYFRKRYPRAMLTFHTNGVDDEFVGMSNLPEAGVATNGRHPLTVLFAGNIGEGQGLHDILPELAERLQGRVRFRIIGDGGRRQLLEERLGQRGAQRVELLSPIPRAQLVAEYQKADVLFLHLNDYPAFEKLLPSKVFEYAATGKPIWAGVSGYAASFLSKHVDNAQVFAPCDPTGAVAAFGRLDLVTRPRPEFIDRFSRRRISSVMAREVLTAMQEAART